MWGSVGNLGGKSVLGCGIGGDVGGGKVLGEM